MRRFEPVHLPPDRRLNAKASQTFLRHYNGCPRSAYLYALYKGEASSPELQRGSGLHETLERGTRAMVDADEPTIPPELVKAIVNEVLADPEFVIPVEEHDYIRESAYRWGAETAIDPRAVIACETLFVVDLGGFEVRAKVDFAQLLEGGAAVLVRDYKSSRHLPPFDDVARKRADGSMAAKNFQLILYAVALAFGVPVRIEPCSACPLRSGVVVSDCEECGGRGHVEIREPFPLAARAQRFDLEFVYPGIEGKDGRMATRPCDLTRLELEEYRASLEGLLRRVAHSEETGDWPAVVSDSACGECPAKPLCPIPVELRDHRGTVNTMAEAAEAAEVLEREAGEHKARREELKRFAKANGGEIRYGADKALRFVYRESEEIRDKDEMWSAVERAVRYGEAFESSAFVRSKKSTNFVAVTLSEEELAEERARAIESEGSSV